MDEGLNKRPKDIERLPEYITMYEISGQDPINIHSLERYKKNKKCEDKKIIEATRSSVFNYKIKNKTKVEHISEDEKVRIKWISMVGSTFKSKKAELIEQGFATGDVVVQKACASMIWDVPKDKRAVLAEKVVNIIKHGLFSKDKKIQKACAEMIPFAQNGKEIELLEQGLTTNQVEVQKICARIILFLPLTDSLDSLKRKVCEIIEQSFITSDKETQKAWIEMIKDFIPTSDRIAKLIEQSFITGDIEIEKRCMGLIHLTPKTEREKLLKLAKEKMGNALVEPPLYDYKDISREKFSRNRFTKTGSEIILIGGKLKDKAILRCIEPEAFLVWQKLYEDYEVWRKAGFDYVPIEPIHSFKLNENGLVDVYSGVLDLNLFDWNRLSEEFKMELEKDKKNIERVLSSNNIKHGHPHNQNFCLRFFRDKSGNVDFSKKPRIYLIDFDQAFSP